ncbi:hypothetical protein MRX96_009125 [Rhipicephalus microplus]
MEHRERPGESYATGRYDAGQQGEDSGATHGNNAVLFNCTCRFGTLGESQRRRKRRTARRTATNLQNPRYGHPTLGWHARTNERLQEEGGGVKLIAPPGPRSDAIVSPLLRPPNALCRPRSSCPTVSLLHQWRLGYQLTGTQRYYPSYR